MARRTRYSKIINAYKEVHEIVEQQENIRARSRQRTVNKQPIRMPSSNKLIKASGNKWEFAGEASLEEFVYENLDKVFSLKPLAR